MPTMTETRQRNNCHPVTTSKSLAHKKHDTKEASAKRIRLKYKRQASNEGKGTTAKCMRKASDDVGHEDSSYSLEKPHDCLVRPKEAFELLKLLWNRHRIIRKGDMVLWNIPNFTAVQKINSISKNSEFRSLVSDVFDLSTTHHKFRLRIFANGCGKSRNKDISIFVQMARTDKDSTDESPQYPFKGVLTFVVIDQSESGERKHHPISVRASPKSPSFQKPKEEFNPENGVESLISLDTVHRKVPQRYLRNDTLLIGAAIRYNELVE